MKAELQSLKEKLLKALPKYRSICILTHKNPDGDGLCAALALQEIIANLHYSAQIVVEKDVPENYDFLEGSERIKIFRDTMLFDLLIVLDCHEEERLGKCIPLLRTAKEIFVIDHHIQQELIPDAHVFIDADTVSAGSILFSMFEEEITTFPKTSADYIAAAIYTTIVNDTDNFINMNTDTNTFVTCSKLMKYDIVPGKITEDFLLSKPVNEMRFVGEALANIQTFDADAILFIVATETMLERYDLLHKEISKLTRWVKGVKNVKVVISFQEVYHNRFRLSLRSNVIDVNKIAVKYGGGGHLKASGCEIKGSLEEIQKQLLADIRKQL